MQEVRFWLKGIPQHFTVGTKEGKLTITGSNIVAPLVAEIGKKFENENSLLNLIKKI